MALFEFVGYVAPKIQYSSKHSCNRGIKSILFEESKDQNFFATNARIIFIFFIKHQ